jgi:hypothetical protein
VEKQSAICNLQPAISRLALVGVFMCFAASQNTASGQIMSNLHYVILIEEGRIYFDSGYNQGVREGMHFQIYRMGDDGRLAKLARMRVTETFESVSRGVLVAEDIGVEVKIGDRVEILPVEESSPTNVIQKPMQEKGTRLNSWSWLTLGAGIVSGGLALHFHNEMNDAYDQYLASKTPSEIANFRDETEQNLRRYRVFSGASVGLLAYTAYRVFFNRGSADAARVDKAVSAELSYIPMRVRFKYTF